MNNIEALKEINKSIDKTHPQEIEYKDSNNRVEEISENFN